MILGIFDEHGLGGDAKRELVEGLEAGLAWAERPDASNPERKLNFRREGSRRRPRAALWSGFGASSRLSLSRAS